MRIAISIIALSLGFQQGQGAGLRSRATKHQQGGRRLDEEYEGLEKLLNITFDGNCHVYATGSGPSTPTLSTVCSRGPVVAVMTAQGITDPIPQTFILCKNDSNDSKSGKDLPLTGNVQDDIDQVKQLLQEDDNSPYETMVKMLNKTFDGSCDVYATGVLPSPPTLSVVCSQGNVTAVLSCAGTTNPIPQSLEVCHGSACRDISLANVRGNDASLKSLCGRGNN